jgi:hypothetical protein
MLYEHVQTGRLAIPTSVFLIVVAGVALPSMEDGSTLGAVLLILTVFVVIAVTVMFSRLKVTVDTADVIAAFGVGWPKKRIPMSDISAARQVRNQWFYGWGLRMIPGGSMFSVWGLDAVELELTSGKVFRVGTDEPEQVLAALPAYLRR